MAEIKFTLPTVQYGNVKIVATPEELGVDLSAPASIGTAYAVYLNLFTQGFKTGSSLDLSVSPTEGLKAPVSASEGEVGSQAQAWLDEGLGGVTEVEEYDSATEAKEAAQARTAGAAPWDNPQVDAKPKPWETDVTAPAVLDPSW
jgi:hypothetical protein